jgi:hypothetical protein
MRHRSDNTQAAIVKELRKRYYIVEIIGEPVDLIIRKPNWPINLWVMAEAKTANRVGGKFTPKKSQKDQHEFCIANGVPYWTTIEQALEYLNHVDLQLNWRT